MSASFVFLLKILGPSLASLAHLSNKMPAILCHVYYAVGGLQAMESRAVPALVGRDDISQISPFLS